MCIWKIFNKIYDTILQRKWYWLHQYMKLLLVDGKSPSLSLVKKSVNHSNHESVISNVLDNISPLFKIILNLLVL